MFLQGNISILAWTFLSKISTQSGGFYATAARCSPEGTSGRVVSVLSLRLPHVITISYLCMILDRTQTLISITLVFMGICHPTGALRRH